MNYMHKQFGFESRGQRRPHSVSNSHWYLCQLSLTAWAKHLAQISGSCKAAGELPGNNNLCADGPKAQRAAEACVGSHSAADPYKCVFSV